jgi:hypothetical protein
MAQSRQLRDCNIHRYDAAPTQKIRTVVMPGSIGIE